MAKRKIQSMRQLVATNGENTNKFKRRMAALNKKRELAQQK